MTHETKTWILQVRKRAAKLHSGSNTNPWNDLEDALIQIERLEEIKESKEKEIERLNFIITTVLDPSRKLSKIDGLEAK